jgi:hypothetical protein
MFTHYQSNVLVKFAIIVGLLHDGPCLVSLYYLNDHEHILVRLLGAACCLYSLMYKTGAETLYVM